MIVKGWRNEELIIKKRERQLSRITCQLSMERRKKGSRATPFRAPTDRGKMEGREDETVPWAMTYPHTLLYLTENNEL